MQIHDDRIPEPKFADFLEQMPQCCVEIVLQTTEGILLTKRTNEPAKGEWFWPGSRLYKGERLEAASHRVADEELGVDVEIIGRLGVYEHFWDTSSIPGASSRHTVNVAYHVQPLESPPQIELDDQHNDYRFISSKESGLHRYVDQYLEEISFHE